MSTPDGIGPRLARSSLVAISLACWSPHPGSGQIATTGELSGTIVDSKSVPAGGTPLRVAGPQGERSALSAADGSFLFQLLPVGRYSLFASPGSGGELELGGIDVRRGTRTRIEVRLPPEISETVTVSADAPAIDLGSTELRIEIGSELLEHLPVGRSVGEAVALSPGVNSSAGGTGASPGKGNPSISGASGLENVYIIDGVPVADAGYGGVGAYSSRLASKGTGLPFDFIESVDVSTGGFGVEYGNALGGVVNLLTKSGSNDLRGSLFAYWAPDALRGDRQEPELDNRTIHAIEAIDEIDAGFTLGGPLSRDRAHYFVAYNPQRRSIDKLPDPDSELAAAGAVSIRETRHAYAGKLSWLATERQQLSLTAFGDPGDSGLGPQLDHPTNFNENPNYESSLDFGSSSAALRYSAQPTDWLSLEAQISRSTTDFQELLPAESDRHFILDLTGAEALVSGGPGYYETNRGERTQYQGKGTAFLGEHGRHELTFGASFEAIDYLGDDDFSGPAGSQFVDAEGTLYTYDSGLAAARLCLPDETGGCQFAYLVLQGFLLDPNVTSSSDGFTIFLEDRWYPTPTLTITAGLRADEQRLDGGSARQSVPGFGTVTPRSYEFRLEDHLAPRLGFAWDFTGEGRGKLFLAAGRHYQRLGSSLAAVLSPAVQGVNVVYLEQPGLPIEQNFDPRYQTFDYGDPVLAIGGIEMRAGTRLPYQDEALIGAELELRPGLLIGGRYLHRELGRAVEDFSLVPNEMLTAGLAGDLTFVAGNPGDDLDDTCPEEHPNCWADPERLYDAVELVVERRLADDWSLLGSYRWSHVRGNYEGLFSTAVGIPGNVTSMFDLPNNTEYTDEELAILCGDTDDLAGCLASLPAAMSHQGRTRDLPTDRRHQIQMAATYRPSERVGLGAALRAASGLPQTRYSSGGYFPGNIPITTEGRTPWSWQLDFHADFEFALPGGRFRGTAILDLFNVTDNGEAVAYDPYIETFIVGSPNSDLGKPFAFQEPRAIRLGLRIEL